MSDPSPIPPPSPAAANPSRAARRFFQLSLLLLSAWFVPGSGHFLLRRRGRAFAFFFAVGGLAFAGFAMRGFSFPLHSNSPFGTLGFLADVSSGLFYFLAKIFERHGADLSRAAGDVGTRFLAASGVVNWVAVIDALEIAAGRRL